MNAATTLKKFGLEQVFHYIYKDPDKNMLKIMDWADKFAGDNFVSQRAMIREAITNPEHPYYTYVRRLFTDIDRNVTRTLAVNFFINAGLVGWPREEDSAKNMTATFRGQSCLTLPLPATSNVPSVGPRNMGTS